MIIAIDVDDVVADLVTAWLAAYNADYDDTLRPDDIGYWTAMADKTKCGSKIYSYLDASMYQKVLPVDNAKMCIDNLVADGHEILFVTSAMREHAGAKSEWLRRFQFIKDAQAYRGLIAPIYIEATDKSRIHADVLVDDNPTNIQAFHGQAIVFSRPWNTSLDWPCRAKNWDEVMALLPNPIVGSTLSEDYPVNGRSQPDLTTGYKADDGKPRFDLVPAGPLTELAQLYTFGARKYADHNWSKGMKWSRLFSAMMRHAWKFWAGENNDAETGLSHMASVAFCAFGLMDFTTTHPELDDRLRQPKRGV